MSTPIVPSDAPHAVKYDRPTETYRVLNAAGIIVDRYQHDSGDFSGRRAMYRLALEDAAVRDAAAARAEARAWADAQDAIAAAEQAADEAAAQAMDASMDMTCYCELCGGAVLPEDAALVGEQMACPDCAPSTTNVGEAVVAQWFGEWCEARALGEPQAWIDGKLQAIRTLGYYVVRPAGVGPWHLAAAVDGAWRIIATEPATPSTGPRLLWSWAGNAAALRGLMDERHAAWFARAAATVAAAARDHRRAAWFARQERMRVTAGELGLLSREAK